MNTESNGEDIYPAKQKNRIEVKPLALRSRAINDKIENKKHNHSFSYNTSTSPYSTHTTRINNQRNHLDDIDETSSVGQENEENIVNQTQKPNLATITRPKKVIINDKVINTVCVKETSADSPPDSENGDFECDHSKIRKSHIGILKNFAKTASNLPFNPTRNSIPSESQKRPYFSSNYYTLKKMLDEKQTKKSIITEIEESRLQDYKKSKHNKSYQNLRSNNGAMNVSGYNMRSNNEDNSNEVSRDYQISTTRGAFWKYRDNIHTIVKIQKVWKGHNLRLKLYLSLTRYYKGRAFVLHFNVVTSNLFRRFVKYCAIERFMKPIRILKRIFHQSRRKVLRVICKHSYSAWMYKRGNNLENVNSLVKSLRNCLAKRFSYFLVNVLRSGLDKISILNKAIRLQEEKNAQRFFDLEIYTQDVSLLAIKTTQIDKEFDQKDFFVNFRLKKLLRNKSKAILSHILRILQKWRLRNSCEKLNELIIREKEQENAKISSLSSIRICENFVLEIKNIEKNIPSSNYLFNRLVLNKIADQENLSRKIFIRWMITSYRETIIELSKLEISAKILHSIHNQEAVEIIPESTPASLKDNQSYSIDTSSLLIKSVEKEIEDKLLIKSAESIQIDSDKQIKTNKINVIENSSSMEILSSNNSEEVANSTNPTTKKRVIKKIVKILRIEKKISPQLDPAPKSEEKINNVQPIEPKEELNEDILIQPCLTPLLTSQNIINFNISNSNDKNNVKNYQAEIKKGIKLMLIDHKRNMGLIFKRLKSAYTIWKENTKKLRIKSQLLLDKKNLFNSLSSSHTKEIKAKTSNKVQNSNPIKPCNINNLRFLIKFTKISLGRKNKLLSKNFNLWKKTANAFRVRNSIACNNLKKFLIFFYMKNLNKAKIFSEWRFNTKYLLLGEKKATDKTSKTLKISPEQVKLLRFFDKFAHYNFNCNYNKSRAFAKWKNSNITSNLLNSKINLVNAIATRSLVGKLKRIFLSKTIPIIKRYVEIKNLSIKKSLRMNFILNNLHMKQKLLKKTKFIRWMKVVHPMRERYDFVKIICSFTKICETFENLIRKVILKSFLKKIKKSADWRNPKPKPRQVKVVKYFLQNGSVVEIERENYNQNLIWKFAKPLKYYFLKMRIQSLKSKEVQLKSISKKWQIERK